MRILLVNDYISKIGGAELYNHFLKKGLEEKGHEVVLAGKEDKMSPKNYPYSWYDLSVKREVSEILDKFKPDLVHVHSFGYISPSFFSEVKDRGLPLSLKMGNVSLICPKSRMMYRNKEPCKYGFSERCFLTGCFLGKRSMLGKLHTLADTCLGKFILHRQMIKKYVDYITSPSGYLAKWAKKTFHKKIKVIKNPTLLEKEDEIKINNKSKRVLFVGRMKSNKGVETLLESIRLLRDKGQVINLELIGDGPEKTRLQKLAKEMNIRKNVKFLGKIKHEKVKERYRNSDLFILPSTIPENCPLTIIEAMSQGTPVITTNLGGQKELIEGGETGLLVEERNPRDLADKIEKIIDNKKLQEEMSENCLKHVEKFSREKHLDKMEKYFQEMIGSEKNGG